ncbi:methyltransferase type 12 [Actinocatenispora thailandica]|uniref:Methyltransferase type 12 n=1 Tax=Actinocatenispora thailandica TaxID=227318 RepID=A0A7R7DL52_9ACTN|nr:class I SAM-dependent methyltransferase [Actinocatenispora thailandica]BCJ33362.1 methyltransferase type 12 [Actinocatenispora thailandica]
MTAPLDTTAVADGTAASPIAMYDAALARHTAGAPPTLTAHPTRSAAAGHDHPASSTVDIATWCAAPSDTDRALVARCAGATLDVGCGPGRFTLAVAAAGIPALGVDIAPAAVALVRARGGIALRRSVFGRLPGQGRWRHVLLADGNIGIGADPVRLLRRCRELLAAGGTVLVEVGPPGTGSGTAALRLRDGERCSAPFRWAYLSVDALADTAAAAGLQVRTQWTEAGRWFAELAG